ncbi:MAG: hypothetical protein ABI896_05620 [Actinomycetota bacterium]
MKLDRRIVLLVAAVVLAAIVAASIVYAVGRDDSDLPRYPGRVAVRAVCGLRHTFFNGDDPETTCLPKVWAAVSVSWNGRRVAWDTGSGIYIANADGFNPTGVPVPPGANFDPSLSPDAGKVAFLHSSRDDGHYDLWVGSTSIDNAEQLTTTRDVSTVVWSPTGDWIAYVKGLTDQTLDGDIVLIHPDGTDGHKLTRGDSPTWSPRGDQLAFAHEGNIWTIDEDGSDARMVIENGESPAWSRDGKLIAFMREVPCEKPVCNERVFVAGAAGEKAQGIGPSLAGPRSPIWLRDPFE